jgi:release factor glutamine methyltransferase
MSAEPVQRPVEWSLGQLLSRTREYFAQHRVDDPRLSAEVLLAHAAGCRRIELYTRFDQVLESTRLDAFREKVRRAAAHEPIAYLVGEKEFFSLMFHVSPDVLIPRPETESLVESILDHCRRTGLESPTILDIGTGSGCIPIAVLKQLPEARAVATDISTAALEVARSNRDRYGLADRLELVEADGLSIQASAVPEGGFEVLVCNPPYVPVQEFHGLGTTVRRYEPQGAITDGADGLTMYRILGEGAGRLVRPGGAVFVEMADGTSAAVMETMTRPGILVHRETVKDRVVGRERVGIFAVAV